MQRRHLFIALAAAIGLATGGAVQAQNYKSEYKLSTVVPASFPWGKGGEKRSIPLSCPSALGRSLPKISPRAARRYTMLGESPSMPLAHNLIVLQRGATCWAGNW